MRGLTRPVGWTLAVLGLGAIALASFAFFSAVAVLRPQVDSPEYVDAIVVVEGAMDDRYVYARHLAEKGVADHILVSQTRAGYGPGATVLDKYCDASPVIARDGRHVDVECFSPLPGTTEGEAVVATQIARERGWDSLLIVTYWGHVSRVRIYFEQCFVGDVYVTDTPRPTQISRRYALLHETAGYVKAFLKPAC